MLHDTLEADTVTEESHCSNNDSPSLNASSIAMLLVRMLIAMRTGPMHFDQTLLHIRIFQASQLLL